MASEDEVKRRQLVAAAKRAGTIIRKEEIVRQRLTADVNLPRAEAVQEQLKQDLDALPGGTLRKIMEEGLASGDVVEAIAEQMDADVRAPMNLITGQPIRHIEEANNMIATANKVLTELDDQGIHIAPIEEIPVPERQAPLDLYTSLKIAHDRVEIVVDFFNTILNHYPEITEDDLSDGDLS